MKKKFIVLALMLSVLLAACGDSTPTSSPTQAPATATPSTLAGQTQRLGAGTVKSWVKVDETGKPASLGLTFDEMSLQNLPIEGGSTVLALPKEVANQVPVNHISIDWNPQGHEPAGIYDKPHFDFHFYYISQEERATIKPGDANVAKQPAPEAIPTDYIAPAPSVVPNMGIHWLDKTTPELNGKPFTTTFLYGYSAGKMIFGEPMITKAYLESKPDMTQDLKLPGAYPKSAFYYPTRYSVKYNAADKSYTISLDGLTQR
jgi:hypothetical protein